jgi:uncharacterized protein (DUF697 family)
MSEKEAIANSVVGYYTKWAMGAGTIPVPLVDLAAVSGVQIQMLSKLSELYEVPFSENSVKSIVASLVGALVPARLGWSAGYAVASTVKSFPVVGTVLGIGTVAVVAGATTYAVGKVFVRHFEEGGTFLSFDSGKMKEYFQEQYEKGAEVAKRSRRSKNAPQADGAQAEPA